MVSNTEVKAVRQEFLEKFIKELILLSNPTPQETQKPTHQMAQVANPPPHPNNPINKIIQSRPRQKIPPKSNRPPKFRPAVKGRPISTEIMNLPAMRKVAALLSDPAVLSVESPGPDKNLIVNRSGTIQPTQTTLSKAEINEIMKELSEKSRIPLVSGIFKAYIGNLFVTATISEFIGSRFLLQKRLPGQAPPGRHH